MPVLSPLSEQQLVDCDLVDSTCNGVFVDNGFAFGEKNGLCTEASHSYTASFIAVGDWGHNEWCHGNVRPGCQRVAAEAMKDFMESEDDRIKFIVHVGDSFYCDGVGGMTTTVGHGSGRTSTVTKMRLVTS